MPSSETTQGEKKVYQKNSGLLTTTWVMTREMVEVVDQVITARLLGEKVDVSEFSTRAGRSDGSRSSRPYQIVNQVAVIEAVGVMGKRMSMFSAWSGGISTQFMQIQIEQALDDDEVLAVVVDLESPGGSVDGIMQLGEWLNKTRGARQKPLYCFANGQAASGGYLLAACCDKIYCERPSTIGSMAVVTCHYDRSQADAKNGLKRTFITSGKYKRMANDAEPLTQEGREYLQYFVDSYHSMFVELVATGRGKDPETVGSLFADGRVWLAKEALELGMIDGIKTLGETIEAARMAAMEDENVNLTEFAAKHPEAHKELMAQASAEAKADYEAKLATLAKVAVDETAAETNRIFGLYDAVHGPEMGRNFMKLACSGASKEQIEAMTGLGIGTGQRQVNDQQQNDGQETNKQILEQLQQGDQQVKNGAGGNGPVNFMAAVDMIVERDRCTRMQATVKAAKEFKSLHEAYKSGGQ